MKSSQSQTELDLSPMRQQWHSPVSELPLDCSAFWMLLKMSRATSSGPKLQSSSESYEAFSPKVLPRLETEFGNSLLTLSPPSSKRSAGNFSPAKTSLPAVCVPC